MFKSKSIIKFELLSTIVIMILGVILHFTYDWTNNTLVGLFTPINESIWEHLKLLFFPMILTMILGYFYDGKNYENYICAKILGMMSSMIFTVISYYTYSGILGKNIDIINISLFFVSVILGQYVVLKNIKSNKNCKKAILMLVIILMAYCFFIFTFNPPKIGLFKDPMTGKFGL